MGITHPERPAPETYAKYPSRFSIDPVHHNIITAAQWSRFAIFLTFCIQIHHCAYITCHITAPKNVGMCALLKIDLLFQHLRHQHRHLDSLPPHVLDPFALHPPGVVRRAPRSKRRGAPLRPKRRPCPPVGPRPRGAGSRRCGVRSEGHWPTWEKGGLSIVTYMILCVYIYDIYIYVIYIYISKHDFWTPMRLRFESRLLRGLFGYGLRTRCDMDRT